MPRFLEPSKAPRGPDVVAIEGRKRAISAMRLRSYYVPEFSEVNLGYKQKPFEGRKRTQGPYSSVQEGLQELVAGVEAQQNAGNNSPS